MVRTGTFPTPKPITSAKTSDHVATTMHDEALLNHLFHGIYNIGSFYRLPTSTYPKLENLSSALHSLSKSMPLYFYIISLKKKTKFYTLDCYSFKKRGDMREVPEY